MGKCGALAIQMKSGYYEPMRKTRRENIILEPVLNRVKDIADYSEISIFKVEEYDYRLILYRGNTPQSEALSINVSFDNLDREKIQVINITQDIIASLDEQKIQRKDRPEANENKGKSCVFIPVKKADQVLAGVYLEYLEADYFTMDLAEEIQNYLQSEIQSIETGMILAEAVQRNSEVDSLFAILKMLNLQLDLLTILDLVVKNARKLVYARHVFVFLRHQHEYELSAMDQTIFDDLQAGDIFRFHEIYLEYPRQRIVISDEQQTPASNQNFIELMKSERCLAVEINSHDRVMGFLMVVDKNLGDFGNADYRILSMLASMAGPAIQNSMLFQRTRNMAVLEERDRLSRELHDDLAQRMVYFKVETSLIKRYTNEDKMEQAGEHMALLESAIDDTYENLREIIFNLREELQPEEGFMESLRRYLLEYRRLYGLEVRLTDTTSYMPAFSRDEVAQISRIIQEGLMNVRKHASINRAEILLHEESGMFYLQMIDEGIGFQAGDIEDSARLHFGTKIMHERANSIGGSLEIYSEPGYGTIITLSLPVAKVKENE